MEAIDISRRDSPAVMPGFFYEQNMRNVQQCDSLAYEINTF